MHIFIGLVLAGLVIWVWYSHWREKARNTQPIEIDFGSDLPLPYGGCYLDKNQVACRFFQRLAVTDNRIEMFQFPEQHLGSGMTFDEVIVAFAALAKDPLKAVHPFPAHLMSFYLNGALRIASDHRGKNIVFAGTKWNSQHEGVFFLAVGPNRHGAMIEKTFGRESQTLFDKNFVFAVHRPTVTVPIGLLGSPRRTAIGAT